MSFDDPRIRARFIYYLWYTRAGFQDAGFDGFLQGQFQGYCAALRLFGYGGKIAEWLSEYEDQQSELPEGTLIGVVGKSILPGDPKLCSDRLESIKTIRVERNTLLEY